MKPITVTLEPEDVMVIATMFNFMTDTCRTIGVKVPIELRARVVLLTHKFMTEVEKQVKEDE
jgi:hypothetical protein